MSIPTNSIGADGMGMLCIGRLSFFSFFMLHFSHVRIYCVNIFHHIGPKNDLNILSAVFSIARWPPKYPS